MMTVGKATNRRLNTIVNCKLAPLFGNIITQIALLGWNSYLDDSDITSAAKITAVNKLTAKIRKSVVHFVKIRL